MDSLKHIIRSPVKSLLIAAVSLFFTVVTGFMVDALRHFADEVERLYDTTVVSGEVRQAVRMEFNQDDIMQNNILAEVVYSLIDLGYFGGYFIDSGIYFVSLGTEFAGVFLGVNDPDGLVQESVSWSNVGGRLMPEERLTIEFAEGFSRLDFEYSGTPIPALVSIHALFSHDLVFGDIVDAVHTEYRHSRDEDLELVDVIRNIIPIKIIGTHNAEIARPFAQGAILIPIDAVRAMKGSDMRYITMRFDIDTAFNREINEIREQMQLLVRNNRQRLHMEMTVDIRDEELRLVVGQMERNLILLTLMYPIAIFVSVVIGTVMAIILVMQNAKIAAIMRVLGNKKSYVRRKLCLEYILLVVTGIIAGLIFMLVIGITFAAAASLMYIAGAITGSVIGGVIITSRSPLELLQVRE
jgi:hypothetical protein